MNSGTIIAIKKLVPFSRSGCFQELSAIAAEEAIRVPDLCVRLGSSLSADALRGLVVDFKTTTRTGFGRCHFKLPIGVGESSSEFLVPGHVVLDRRMR